MTLLVGYLSFNSEKQSEDNHIDSVNDVSAEQKVLLEPQVTLLKCVVLVVFSHDCTVHSSI